MTARGGADAGRKREVLTTDDMRVIRERHFGWEKAAPALLAQIFNVSHQMITAVLRRTA